MKLLQLFGLMICCFFVPNEGAPSISILKNIQLPSLKWWNDSPKTIVQPKPVIVPEYPAFKIHKYQGFRLTPVPVSEIPVYTIANQPIAIQPHILREGLHKIRGLLGTSSDHETISAIQEIASTSDGLAFMTDYVQNNFGLKDISESQVKHIVNDLHLGTSYSTYTLPSAISSASHETPISSNLNEISSSSDSNTAFGNLQSPNGESVSGGSSSGAANAPAKTYGPPTIYEKPKEVKASKIEEAFVDNLEPSGITAETSEGIENDGSFGSSSSEESNDALKLNEAFDINGGNAVTPVNTYTLPIQTYGVPPLPPKPYSPVRMAVSSQILGNVIQDLSPPVLDGGASFFNDRGSGHLATPVQTYSIPSVSYGAPPTSYMSYSLPNADAASKSFSIQNPIVVGTTIRMADDVINSPPTVETVDFSQAKNPEFKVRLSESEESGRPVKKTEYEQEGFTFIQLSAIPLDRTVSFEPSSGQVSSYGDSIDAHIFRDQLPAPSEPRATSIMIPSTHKNPESQRPVIEQYSTVSSNNPTHDKYQRRKWMPKKRIPAETSEVSTARH